jgi:hypothetical protein
MDIVIGLLMLTALAAYVFVITFVLGKFMRLCLDGALSNKWYSTSLYFSGSIFIFLAPLAVIASYL